MSIHVLALFGGRCTLCMQEVFCTVLIVKCECMSTIDNLLLHADTYSLSTEMNDGSLTISPATVGDTSVLNCRASSIGGSINTAPVQLIVISEYTH